MSLGNPWSFERRESPLDSRRSHSSLHHPSYVRGLSANTPLPRIVCPVAADAKIVGTSRDLSE